jgi:hypothetical protein
MATRQAWVDVRLTPEPQSPFCAGLKKLLNPSGAFDSRVIGASNPKPEPEAERNPNPKPNPNTIYAQPHWYPN